MSNYNIAPGVSLIIGKACSGKTTAISKYINDLVENEHTKVFFINLYDEDKVIDDNVRCNCVTSCSYNPYQLPNNEENEFILNHKIDFLINIHERIRKHKLTGNEKKILGNLLFYMYTRPNTSDQEIYDLLNKETNLTKEAVMNIRSAADSIRISPMFHKENCLYKDSIGVYDESKNFTSLCYNADKFKVIGSELRIQKLCFLDFVYCQMINHHYSDPKSKCVLIIDDVLEFLENNKDIQDYLETILKACRMYNGSVVLTTSVRDAYSAKDTENIHKIMNHCQNIELFGLSKKEVKVLADGFSEDQELINKTARLNMGEHLSLCKNDLQEKHYG